LNLWKAVGGYEKSYFQRQTDIPLFAVKAGSVVRLIGATAGCPENASEEDNGEASNDEKNHGRSPCQSRLGR
jgi:hypothetical protein